MEVTRTIPLFLMAWNDQESEGTALCLRASDIMEGSVRPTGVPSVAFRVKSLPWLSVAAVTIAILVSAV